MSTGQFKLFSYRLFQAGPYKGPFLIVYTTLRREDRKITYKLLLKHLEILSFYVLYEYWRSIGVGQKDYYMYLKFLKN